MKHFRQIILIPLFFLIGSHTLYADITIQEFNTKKNIHILFVEDQTTDLVSVFFAFKGTGAKTDPTGKQGLVNLMTQLLMERSTEGSDRTILQKKLKALGVLGGFQYAVDRDNISFQFKCPVENLKLVFDTIKVYFSNPTFDSKELAKMKAFDPASSRLATSSEQEFASKILVQKLFNGHPYAHPASGTLDGRQSVTVEDIKDAFKNRFAQEVLVFSVVGELSPKLLVNYIEDTFGVLPEKAKLPKISTAFLEPDGQTTIIPKDSAQSGVVFGQKALPIQNKDYYAFIILNNILGGKPFTCRLWAEAREKEGLVYSIYTELLQWKHAELLVGAFESDNTAVQKVIALIRKQWEELKDYGVSEEEFQASKTGLLGGYVLNFTSPDGIAQAVLNTYLTDLPTNYINEHQKRLSDVKLKDVNRIAKKYLDPDHLTFVVVGNPP